MNLFTEINEAYAYILVGLLIIIMKVTNLVNIDWFWIILTITFPALLSVAVFLIACFIGFIFR